MNAMLKILMGVMFLSVCVVAGRLQADEILDVADVSDDEITEEMQKLIDKGGILIGNELDGMCVLFAPEPYLIHYCTTTACTGTGYTAVTNIWEDPEYNNVWRTCIQDAPESVQGVKVWWYASSAICNYCGDDSWDGKHWYWGTGYVNDNNGQSCWTTADGGKAYYSYEANYYTNYGGFHVTPQPVKKFGRSDMNSSGFLTAVDCD